MQHWIQMSSKGFCAILLTGMAMVAASNAQQFPAGEREK
jgi:hypothetical protein